MGPTQAILSCLKKSITTSGRATRSEFWWFALGCFAVLAFINVIFIIAVDDTAFGLIFEAFEKFMFVLATAISIPLLTVGLRRLRDAEKTNGFLIVLAIIYWLFVLTLGAPFIFGGEPLVQFEMIIVIGPILFVIMLILAIINTIFFLAPSSNKYGPNPNEVPS